jgi:hypothetical protein
MSVMVVGSSRDGSRVFDDQYVAPLPKNDDATCGEVVLEFSKG